MVERKRKRDYALERERSRIRAQGAGFRNARDRALFNKEYPAATARQRESWQRKRVLDLFGITQRELNAIRRENREHLDRYAVLNHAEINVYNLDIDERENEWSEARLGYILSFNAAIVNSATNYDSLRQRGVRLRDKNGKPLMNRSQYWYLVKYTGLMTQSYYEARYGRTTVHDINPRELGRLAK